MVDDVKEKIKNLSAPKGYGVIPVLLYVGELSEKVIDSGFFYKMIDLEEYLGQ